MKKWPALPYAKWKNTLDTLHMWMQIVGKIKLKLSPFINQWWEVAFFITSYGITTGKIPYKDEIFQLDFDFLNHNLIIQTSWRKTITFPLKSKTVAEFYKELMAALIKLGIDISISPVPVEIQNPIPFAKDTVHASYDKEYVQRWWRTMVKINIVFEQFRSAFRGKSSPIHFFWGSFDLAGTRFSGKKLPDKTDWPKGYKFMRYAENEENFGFGFWPGDERFPHPAFYAYLYPKPVGMETVTFKKGVTFNEQLGECILLYEFVRRSKNPQGAAMEFLQTTYVETAKLAKWDIKSYQTQIPKMF